MLQSCVSHNNFQHFALRVVSASDCDGSPVSSTSPMGHRGANSSRALIGGYQSRLVPTPPMRVLKGPKPKSKKETVLRSLTSNACGKATVKATMKKPARAMLMKGSKLTMPPSKRSVQRLPIHEEPGIGQRARKNQLTVLEERSISNEVQYQYTSHLDRFKSFCRAQGIAWPPSKCDEVLADFLDLEFLDGKASTEGEKVVAAIEFNLLHWRGQLVRSRRALKGWRKERPAGSRLPLPRLVCYGMAMVLCARNKKLEALKLLLDHDTYLRPGESIDLKGRDIVIPVRGAGKQYQHYAVIVRNSLDGQPDKIGVYDNTVLLNSKGREFIGKLLHQRVKSLKSAEDLLFPFTAAKYKEAFTQSGEALGIPGLHPYQTRHGGAAEDLNGGERDHAQVKARGRWMTDTSVRRYTKTGKIQQLMSKLSAAHLEYCRWSLQNVERVMLGLASPKMP
eukprot:s3161_g8.t1